MNQILFTGDRHFKQHYQEVIEDIFKKMPSNVFIFVGDCPTGVDPFVAQCCGIYKKPFHVERARWDKYGDAAGPIRNKLMVEALDPDSNDKCIAVHWDLKRSKGTRNCWALAGQAGITTYHVGKLNANRSS